MLLPYGRVGSGKHLEELILAQHLLMVQSLRVNKALKLQVSLFSDLLDFFLLFDFLISFLDDQKYFLCAFFVDEFKVKHLLWEHLRHIFHQALKEFGTREANIDTQLIARILFQVY